MKNKAILFLSVLLILLTGCANTGDNSDPAPSEEANAVERKLITFGNAGWDSIQFHNAVAGLIAVEAFGYEEWETITGSTAVTYLGLTTGEVDVLMEVWTDNMATYDDDVSSGAIVEMGVNFDDTRGGFYVPRYVIEGDPERGIEPMAPGLKRLEDLIQYKDVFPDDEKPGRSRVYGAIPGWEADTVMYNKYIHYGLDADFEYFRPGSDTALTAAFTEAYTKGKAICAYYWEPTWLMGKYDFVLLEEPPYENREKYMAGACANPSQTVTICVNPEFREKDPEFCEFLDKYRTSSDMTAEALAYMMDTGASHTETAKWFLREYSGFLDSLLTVEQADKVREAL